MTPGDGVESINCTTPILLPAGMTPDAPVNIPVNTMTRDFLTIALLGTGFKFLWHPQSDLCSDEHLVNTHRLTNDNRTQMSVIESDGDSTLSESELLFTEIMRDETAPEIPERGTNWDDTDSRASDGTSVSQYSRSTEDADNPHWTSR
jgi:hypothetical protein